MSGCPVHPSDDLEGDVGAGCGGGATDAVAPFASFEATCGLTTFSARGGSESLPGAHTPNQWSQTDRMAPVVGKRRAKRRKAPPWVQKRGLGSSNPICKWSGRWDSNPRPSAWQADALPLSYARIKTSSTVTGAHRARSVRSRSFWILRRPPRPPPAPQS